MIDKYECSICNEEFCRECNPSLECDLCGKEICVNCEEESTYSDFLHRVICKNCFAAANVQEKNKWKSMKQSSPMGKIKRLKSEKIEIEKVSSSSLAEMLTQLKSLQK